MPEALLPSLPDEEQQIPEDDKRYNTNQQKIFLQETDSLGALLIHEAEIGLMVRNDVLEIIRFLPRKVPQRTPAI